MIGKFLFKKIIHRLHGYFNLRKIVCGKFNIIENHARIIEKSQLKINGNNNRIYIASGVHLKNADIVIIGDDNVIRIDNDVVMKGGNIRICGKCNFIFIGKRVEFQQGINISVLDINGRIEIKDGSRFCFGENSKIECMEDGSQIHIGNDCLFSADLFIRTGDSHSIIDVNSGKRLNHARSIFIGDRVWCAAAVTVLKGAHIDNDSVVGTHSVVTKKFVQPNVVIAGNPARIVRQHIRWDKDLIK